MVRRCRLHHVANKSTASWRRFLRRSVDAGGLSLILGVTPARSSRRSQGQASGISVHISVRRRRGRRAAREGEVGDWRTVLQALPAPWWMPRLETEGVMALTQFSYLRLAH